MKPYAEVIGDPIAQSKSPVIHQYWLGRLGIAAEYRATHVRADALTTYFTERRANPDWRGCNVTMPHKLAVIAHLDAIDPLAARVGAINTVVRGADGSLTGYNTDVVAIDEIVRSIRGAEPSGRKRMVDLIGAGGAARAAITALMDTYPETTVWARDVKKAKALSEELGIGCGCHAPLAKLAKPDKRQPVGPIQGHLIVNASPLGMTGHPPLDIYLPCYPADTIVFDMVYAPLETPLLAQARARGLRTIDGLAMLIGQAAAAFAFFFGVEPPRGDGDAELRKILE